MPLHDALKKRRRPQAPRRDWRRSAQRLVRNAVPWWPNPAADADAAKNVLVVNGHPDPRPERYCAALCQAYALGARRGGRELREIAIGVLPASTNASAIAFDEDANDSSEWAMALEAARWADEYVIIFPLWLNQPPALLRRFFEAVAKSGINGADRFCPEPAAKKSYMFVTMEMPAFGLRSSLRADIEKDAIHGVLSFAGLMPGQVTFIGSVTAITNKRRIAWLEALEEFGADPMSRSAFRQAASGRSTG